MLYFHVMMKKYDVCINADVLPKCPKIGITVGSLLKIRTSIYVLEMLIVRHLGTPNSDFNGCHCMP